MTERLPGIRLEMRLRKRQQSPEHILVVLPIPDQAYFAGRIVQLGQLGIDVRVATRLRATVAPTPKLP